MFGAPGGKGKGKSREDSVASPRPENMPDSAASQVMTAKSERQLFRFDLPQQERGLTDLIKTHKPGDRFQYIALTGADVEDHSSRIRRLVQLRPTVSQREIPITQMPKIKLFKDIEKFPLSQVIPKKGRDFLLINRATILFTPLTSFADDYSVMKCSLIDMRMISNQERSSVRANTNIMVKLEFSMDHCIPREAADQVFLMFGREISNMNAGNMWGVVQVQLEIMELDYPKMENMKEVVAVHALPSSGLETFEKDPMHLDITMHNNHRARLQEFYDDGDVADETAPMKEKTKKVSYAKSHAPGKQVVRHMPGEHHNPSMFAGQVSDGNWSFMKGRTRSRIPDDEASIDPVEEGEEDTESIAPVSMNLRVEPEIVEPASPVTQQMTTRRVQFNTPEV